MNLMTTMLLGGLWHGAGWTFVVWGGLHGAYLIVNHTWRTWRTSRPLEVGWFERWIGTVLTFLAVIVAWVFFRADSFDTATRILGTMTGINGIGLPTGFATALPKAFEATLIAVGFSFDGVFSVRVGDWREGFFWLLLTGGIAFFSPNTYQLFRAYRPAIAIYGTPPPIRSGRLRWRPTITWAVSLAVIFVAAFMALSRPSEFLYFQF
jgi:hypothetical protein